MKILLRFTFIFFFSLVAQAQRGSYNADLANAFYQRKAYTAAITYYKKALKKKFVNDTLLVRLGLCYYYSRRVPEALKVFRYLEQGNKLNDSLQVFYFNTLKLAGDYLTAKKLALAQQDTSFRHLALSCDSAIKWIRKTKPVRVVNLQTVNSEFSETAPSLHPEGLYFLSNRESVLIEKKTDNDLMPFKQAYLASYNADSGFRAPEIFGSFSTSEYHAGSACFVKDSMMAYYTKVVRDKDNVLRSKMFEADLKSGSTSSRVFVMNDSLFSFMNPFIDKEQRIFFFVSNLKGGYGGMDIYASIRINKKWSDPINLGPVINTGYNEISPFYDPKGYLFFSSDRPEGMGGFDNYVASEKNGNWVRIQNLRAPVNSSSDETCFIMNEAGNRAFISSNRPGGKGLEDIYEVTGNLFFLFDK